MELGVGEALVSCLDENGQPQVVERALIVPPRSQLGPISPQQRQQIMTNSIVAGVYDKVVDRESAYEKLTQAVQQTPPPTGAPQSSSGGGFWGSIFGGGSSAPAPMTSARSPGRQPDSIATIATKSVVRSVSSAIGSSIGRQVIRGLMGSLFGGGRRR